MENKNIIIILLVIIVILAVAIGFMLLNTTPAKEPTKIKITSDKEQYEGGKLSVQLTDLNKTPISKEVVNITVTNSKGKVVVDDVVKTNSKGKAEYDLDLKKGKYDVNVTYGGSENYTANSTSQKLIIKEEVKETQEVSHSSSSSSSDEWVYGTGAGASDDPNIHWKRNTKTGYIEYYNEKTGDTWGGYNIA
nr:hypothetical protein [uncultured Methanobrevibacter sp.]